MSGNKGIKGNVLSSSFRNEYHSGQNAFCITHFTPCSDYNLYGIFYFLKFLGCYSYTEEAYWRRRVVPWCTPTGRSAAAFDRRWGLFGAREQKPKNKWNAIRFVSILAGPQALYYSGQWG